jgi:hypothetical protein
MGRTQRSQRGLANGRYRRISPVAAHSGDRLLSEPTAGTQPWRREPLFMSHSGHSSPRSGQSPVGVGAVIRFAAAIPPRCANCRGKQVQQRPCTEIGSTRLPRQRWQAAQENASAGSTATSAIREPPPAISSAGAAGRPLAFGHGGRPAFPPRMHNAAPLQESRRGFLSCNLRG